MGTFKIEDPELMNITLQRMRNDPEFVKANRELQERLHVARIGREVREIEKRKRAAE